jgi:hypothetical protein
MARSFSDIQLGITTAIAAEPALAGITSTSNTSIWGQFRDVIASSLQISEQLADVQELRMNTIADEAVPGTPSWLRRRVLEWQYGDTIQLNQDLTLSYLVEDETKRIVTRCSVQEVNDTREVLLKVAKGDIGNLSPLTLLERQGLEAYLARVKFAGIHLVVVSLQGDRIVTGVSVFYDAQYVVADVKANVLKAINTYYEQLPFDGNLVLTKLTDAIQAVDGVTDVQLGSVIARPATTSVTDPSLMPITRVYNAQSGYLVPETQAGYTLADTVQMFPA